jgi:hypothetical protein
MIRAGLARKLAWKLAVELALVLRLGQARRQQPGGQYRMGKELLEHDDSIGSNDAPL